MTANGKREIWVDNVKVIACVLVVLGHFCQSIIKSEILPNTFFLEWFIDAIYYFHVPLFFICSGYLYQKYTKIIDVNTWKNSVLKKLIALGIPYFVFSTITWVLKKVFSSTVNNQLGGFGETLLKQPASPYWYLYILFIMFFITITTQNIRQQYFLLFISLLLKIADILGFHSGLYFMDQTMNNWIWFVLGMTLVYGRIKLVKAFWGYVLFTIFIIGSLLTQIGDLKITGLGFLLSVVACYSIVCIVYDLFSDGIQKPGWKALAKYTMPIFLMHTLFAATLRSVLFKIGIHNSVVHIVLGLFISFIGPIFAMKVMERIKPSDCLVYPTHYIKV